MIYDALIIGGGMSGMSAALKLKENGLSCVLVTKTLGGRVDFSPKYDCNFRAVFFMENYRHARKLLDDRGIMTVKPGALMLHTSVNEYFKGSSLKMLLSLPQLNRFKKFMLGTFMPEYQAYKDDCEVMSVAHAFGRHPRIARYYHMKASEVIEELGVQKICDNFISKFAYACTGSRIKELSGLDFLNVAQGAVAPIHDFAFHPEQIEQRLDGAVVYDEVRELTRDADAGWVATCTSGASYTARHVIVATPGLTTQKLCGLEEIRQPTELCTYHVAGTPKPKYATCDANYFGDAFDIIAINRMPSGRFNVYTRTELDLSPYFSNFKVLDARIWPEALFTYGDTVCPQNLGDGRIVAGDLNGLGLEPACIAGIYAANVVLGLAKD